jgi:hypothetical protein
VLKYSRIRDSFDEVLRQNIDISMAHVAADSNSRYCDHSLLEDPFRQNLSFGNRRSTRLFEAFPNFRKDILERAVRDTNNGCLPSIGGHNDSLCPAQLQNRKGGLQNIRVKLNLCAYIHHQTSMYNTIKFT